MKFFILLTIFLTVLSCKGGSKILYQYDIEGWIYITYQNQSMKDVTVKLMKGKTVIKKTVTDYSGKFKFKDVGEVLKKGELSNFYILVEKKEYKTVKKTIKWVKNGKKYQFIDKKLNIRIECSENSCMDICCSKDEACSHWGKYPNCIKVRR